MSNQFLQAPPPSAGSLSTELAYWRKPMASASRAAGKLRCPREIARTESFDDGGGISEDRSVGC
jgi:hypothetical protein